MNTEEAMSLLMRWLMGWARSTDEELCGLLYQDGPILVANVSRTPKTEYAMDPVEQVRLMATRGWPLAVFHTHPGGTRHPSNLDHTSALPGVPYAIGCPTGWAGVWLDGQQIMEAVMGSLTNDIVEVYKDEADEWRWRRIAPNGRNISSSGDGYASRSAAAKAAQRANPDAYDNDAGSTEASSVSDAVGDAGAGGAGTGPATGAPGAGAGGNAYGVGPTGA